MNYDEMPAGREMDALVAEKIMGKRTRVNKFMGEEHTEYFTGKNSMGWDIWNDVSHYSTDISAAWEVIEKIKEIPVPLKLEKSWERMYNVGPLGWSVCWCPEPEKDCEGCGNNERCTCGNDVWAESAPLAICRAALKAMEVNHADSL